MKSGALSGISTTIWESGFDIRCQLIWVDGAGESAIEAGKSGDAVGAVRNVLYQGRRIRQKLAALSDIECAQVYEFCGDPPMPVEHYRAAPRVTPIVDGGRSFVEWCASFDCAPEPMTCGRRFSATPSPAGWIRCGAISTPRGRKRPGGIPSKWNGRDPVGTRSYPGRPASRVSPPLGRRDITSFCGACSIWINAPRPPPSRARYLFLAGLPLIRRAGNEHDIGPCRAGDVHGLHFRLG